MAVYFSTDGGRGIRLRASCPAAPTAPPPLLPNAFEVYDRPSLKWTVSRLHMYKVVGLTIGGRCPTDASLVPTTPKPYCDESRTILRLSSQPRPGPLSSEYGTYKTVTARYWPWPFIFRLMVGEESGYEPLVQQRPRRLRPCSRLGLWLRV